jgi:hypothetical protein
MKLAITFAALSLLLYGCRSDKPPRIDVCLGDGAGGADCTLKNGEHVYRSPSQLKNYWMTPQGDMTAFASWCYKTNPANVTPVMATIRQEITGR